MKLIEFINTLMNILDEEGNIEILSYDVAINLDNGRINLTFGDSKGKVRKDV